MTSFGPQAFPRFVEEVTGFEPFPWQQRLLTRVLEANGGWPDTLDLPTGTGKTSAVLIALFALALDPTRFHRRIALVVDRRIIVDQVDRYARRLRDALDSSAQPTTREVAMRLRALAGTDTQGAPVRVVHLRGGIPRDDSWLGTPNQPTIIASTVDQIGSRLLFRGYGVSEGMRPVHAGIVSRDILYLLDEVHLATAFEETLSRLEGTYEDWADTKRTGRRLRVVRMSATPRAPVEGRSIFRLEADDHAHPVLRQRLEVRRPAKLEVVATRREVDAETGASNRAKLAQVASERARSALGNGSRTIAVVLNRVDTARRTAARLSEDASADVLLVTGRMRGLEKAVTQTRLSTLVGAGVPRAPDATPTIVVATSCIEAGADLDFDTMITEAASLDALRQRFGRLDRLGHGGSAKAWVLARKDQVAGERADDDPIYGSALRRTWEYLVEHAHDDVIDFGLKAFPAPHADVLPDLVPTAAQAPVLFPNYLDMWSETRPAPYPDPEPALWLHGKGRRPSRDIQVLFRTDLPEPSEDPNALAVAVEAMEYLPPLSDETVDAPIIEVRRRLGEDLVWRWSADGLEAVGATQLRPNDTVILDASKGGLVQGTWDPGASEAVEDVAELVCFATTNVAKVRVELLPPLAGEGAPNPPGPDATPEDVEQARTDLVRWLDALPQVIGELSESRRAALTALTDSSRSRRVSTAVSLSGEPVWRVTAAPQRRAVQATTEDSVSVFTGIEVTLADHLEDVEAWAKAFAEAAGLDSEVASDVALAGLLHDLGKADPRFQALLRGGDPIAAAGGVPLAKSSQFGSAESRRRAAVRSGWPQGFRHELVSLALLEASPELQAAANDLDLVRHLQLQHRWLL